MLLLQVKPRALSAPTPPTFQFLSQLHLQVILQGIPALLP